MPISREQLVRNTIERELETVNYVRENWYEHDRLAVVILNRDKPAKQGINTASEICEPRFQARLRAENANGGNIYISMNALKPEARGRAKADIGEIRHVFLDIDGPDERHPFTPPVKEALERIRTDNRIPVPHHILESSPGKVQMIWSVSGFDVHRSESLIKGMVREYGGDPAAVDISRILRLPGFANRKYETPHYIHDIQTVTAPNAEYKPADFPEFSQQQARVITMRAPGEQQRVAGNTKSEHDWAEVKDRLKSGQSPDAVRAWLADRRQYDKPGPARYASTTVEKAIKAISEERQQKQGYGMSR